MKAEDSAGRVFDFHALRHQYISNPAAAGVHPKTAQQLARHSTINLTMDRYTHLQLADVAGALDRLPDLPQDETRDAMRATGTDSAQAIGDNPTWLRNGCGNHVIERVIRGIYGPRSER